MKKILLGGILVALLGALVFTNPGWADYETYAREHVAKEVAAFVKTDHPLMRWMSGELFWPAIEKNTDRTNLLLFSIYDFDYTGPNVDGGEYTFLAVMGTFIPLKENPLPKEDETRGRPAQKDPNDHLPTGRRQAAPPTSDL